MLMLISLQINQVFYSRYEAAEADCNRSIKYNPNYVKAYLRRGASRLKLGKLVVAAEDFQTVKHTCNLCRMHSKRRKLSYVYAVQEYNYYKNAKPLLNIVLLLQEYKPTP